MMLPLLPPGDHYQMSRDLWDRAGSRRRARHISSLDLHELGGSQDASRPDPVWMVIRRTADGIGRLAIVQRLQHSIERMSDRETGSDGPELGREGMSCGDAAPDTRRVAPGC